MTEREWLEATHPREMLEFLRDSVTLTERKGRLFAVACCRRVWNFLADGCSRQAVEEAERHAEGLVSTDALHRACKLAVDARRQAPSRFTAAAVEAVDPALRARRSWERAARAVARGVAGRRCVAWGTAERGAQAALVRDLFGNPYRPLPPLDPPLLSANDGLVVQLARAAYDERLLPEGHLDPVRLTELADALEEAGAPEEVLAHLRAPGPHWRGCWAVDHLLGKS
jgi:hypothetical protein